MKMSTANDGDKRMQGFGKFVTIPETINNNSFIGPKFAVLNKIRYTSDVRG
jgi:hypothetical protein